MNEERPLTQLFLVALGVVLLASAGVYVATTRWGSDVSASFSQGTTSGGEEETLRMLNEQAQNDIQAQGALVQAQAGKLLQRAAETKELAAKAKVAAEKWQADVPALLTSDAGRRLASDPARLQSFMAVTERTERPSEGALQAMLDRIKALESELERVRTSNVPALAPETSQQFEAELAATQSEAAAALAAVESDLSSVEALVTASAADTPAGQTLEQALAELKRQQAERHARELHERLARVTEEQHQDDIEMEARKLEEQIIADRKKKEAELEAKRQRTENEASLAEARAEKEKWEERAKSKEVQDNYRAFLDDGRAFPMRHPSRGIIWEPDTTPGRAAGPVSYKQLEDAGALKSFEAFLSMMIPTDLNHRQRNDRGMWTDPSDNAALRADYRQRFEDFKKLGPIWASTGLLKE